jgi:hypothetical protein
MKKMVLAVSFLVCIGSLSAQQKMGIATYSVPAGWQVSEQSSSGVTIENKTKNGICKISIFSTEKPGAVSAITDYTRYRNKMSAANVSYSTARGSITKNETNGIVSFLSYGTGTINGVSFRNYFYSFSNGKETYFVQLSASDNACVVTFNTFLNDLLIDPAEENNTGGTNARRKKAAPAAVPAAPAPMM